MLLDTSVIVEIFRNRADSVYFKRVASEIGDEEVYVSVVQLAEIADWATRNGSPPRERVDAVKELARIVPLDEGICLDAAAIKQRRRDEGHDDFGLIDGIVLRTARSMNQRVLTLDRGFEGERDCSIMGL